MLNPVFDSDCFDPVSDARLAINYARLCQSPISLSNGRVVQCGKCICCTDRRKANKASRLQLEVMAQGADNCTFGTLTFNTSSLSDLMELDHEEPRLWSKRVRTALNERGLPSPKFAIAGEYGSDFGRPHYHVAILGLSQSEVYGARKRNGRLEPIYINEFLSDYWHNGHIDLKPWDAGKAQYLAKYLMKSPDAKRNPLKDERAPEYFKWSNGIGQLAIDQIATALRNCPSAMQKMKAAGDVPRAYVSRGYDIPYDRYMLNKLRLKFFTPEEVALKAAHDAERYDMVLQVAQGTGANWRSRKQVVKAVSSQRVLQYLTKRKLRQSRSSNG